MPCTVEEQIKQSVGSENDDCACPDCGEFELVKCGRCATCRACGFSYCSK